MGKRAKGFKLLRLATFFLRTGMKRCKAHSLCAVLIVTAIVFILFPTLNGVNNSCLKMITVPQPVAYRELSYGVGCQSEAHPLHLQHTPGLRNHFAWPQNV